MIQHCSIIDFFIRIIEEYPVSLTDMRVDIY